MSESTFTFLTQNKNTGYSSYSKYTRMDTILHKIYFYKQFFN